MAACGQVLCERLRRVLNGSDEQRTQGYDRHEQWQERRGRLAQERQPGRHAGQDQEADAVDSRLAAMKTIQSATN